MGKLSTKANSGQALLVILLIMAVVLTIGLSTISRSITDIKISEQTEDSARAFSAAEAGIEFYLSTGETVTDLSGIDVNLFPGDLLTGEDRNKFLYPNKLSQNEMATVWLSVYDKDAANPYSGFLSTNTITVAWGNENTPDDDDSATPALEVSIYYNDSGIKVAKYLLDPNQNRENNFCKINGDNCETGVSLSSAGIIYSDKTLQFSANIPVTSLSGKMYFARLRMLYGTTSHYLGFSAGATLPSQGIKIAAIGKSNQAARKVEVYRLNPAPPDIFDFALYSGGSLIK